MKLTLDHAVDVDEVAMEHVAEVTGNRRLASAEKADEKDVVTAMMGTFMAALRQSGHPRHRLRLPRSLLRTDCTGAYAPHYAILASRETCEGEGDSDEAEGAGKPGPEGERPLAANEGEQRAREARQRKPDEVPSANEAAPCGEELDVSQAHANAAREAAIAQLKKRPGDKFGQGGGKAVRKRRKCGQQPRSSTHQPQEEAGGGNTHACGVGDRSLPGVDHGGPKGGAHGEDERGHADRYPQGYFRAPIARSKTRKMCVYQRSVVLCGSTRMGRTPARLPAMTSVKT